VRLVQIDTDRFGGRHFREYVGRDGRPAGIVGDLGTPDDAAEIPSSFARMVEIAEELARGVDFVRVDLYDTPDGIKFGELTNYPGAAVERWEPESVEIELGACWSLPDVHR
jgi:FPC/CPF motif-containing protein YcgG